jgi:hypothetical protein
MIYVAGMFNSGLLTFGTNTIYKGCGDDVFLAKLGTTTTAIGEYTGENDFLVYPNPSNGIFSISPGFENAEVEIYSAMGEMVYSSMDIHRSIDISTMAKGIYFVKINAEEKVYSRRVVVE